MKNIVEVQVIDKKSGQTEILKTRAGSHCHFMDEFSVGRFIIQLRLDWADLDDEHQEPRLDADIYIRNSVTGKRIKYKSKKATWHQTAIDKDEEGNFVYHFSFRSFELILGRRISIQNAFDGKVGIVRSSQIP